MFVELSPDATNDFRILTALRDFILSETIGDACALSSEVGFEQAC
jgi:hypothetical protein